MSLLLAIYAFKEKINEHSIQAVVDNFSRNRDVELIRTEKFMAVGHSKYTSSCIKEVTEKNTIVAIAGRIYNLDAIKEQKFKNKTAVLTSCFDFISDVFFKEGTGFINELNGAFSLVIYDKVNDELHIANDHFGTYPLFIFKDETHIIISNEYEPILKYGGYKFEIDTDTLAEYLILGAPLGGKTFFCSLLNLKPASYLKVQNREISEHVYTENNIKTVPKISMTEMAEHFVSLFSASVKLRANYNNTRCCSLTGGLDTRLLLCAMPEEIRHHTEFITLLTEPLTEEEDRDVLIAKMIASHLKLNHKTEPMSAWTKIWTHDFDTSFFEDVRYRENKFILSGYYGSELLKGDFINIIPEYLKRQLLYHASGRAKKLRLKLFPNGNIKSSPVSEILSESFKKRISHVYESLDKEINTMVSENKIFEFSIYYLSRSFFSSIYSGSYGSWLTPYKFPLEYGMPFMDKNILKFLLSIPPKILILNDLSLYNLVFRKYYPQLNHIPSNAFMPKIKGFGIEYIKTGVEPKNIKKALYKKAYENCLNTSHTEKWQIFDMDKVQKYKNDENAIAVRPFIELETWLKYIDNL